ncbi:MAG: HU family DNA-binding protein [Proteobacteria bacterium]|nr:HU family DNA-binding protein [Pseudomonadota bacterium]
MTKDELVTKIAEDAGISKKEAGAALKAFTGSVSGALAKGESVSLVGFGTFSVSQRAARTGRNPQTGATIQIKARKVPKFKGGKALKDAVN